MTVAELIAQLAALNLSTTNVYMRKFYDEAWPTPISGIEFNSDSVVLTDEENS